MQFLFLFVFLTVFFLPSFAYAEIANEQIEPVVITASRMEEKISQTSQAITVISQEEIAKNQYQDIGQILRHYGIGISGYAGSDLSQITLRGMRTPLFGDQMTSPILILIDGRRAGTTNISMLPLVSIERIEILRGAASLQYGSSAIAGVINIITKRGKEKPQINAEVGYASWDQVKAQAGAASKINFFDFAGGVAYQAQGQNYQTGKNKDYNNTTLDYRLSYLLNAGFNFLEDQRIGLTFLGVESEKAGSPGSLGYKTPDAFSDRFEQSFDLLYEGQVKNLGLQWQARYFNEQNTYVYDDIPSVYNYTLAKGKSQGTQAELAWKWKFFNLSAGFEWFGNEYRAQENQSKSNLQNYAGFVLAKLFLLDDRLIFNGGLRYDDYYLEVGNKDRTLNNTSYSVGMVGHLLDWLSVRANYGNSFRVPTGLESLGYNSGWTNYIGNKDLKPEQGIGWDLGATLNWQGLNLSATYFSTEYKNKIVSGPVANSFDYQYYNLGGSSKYQGLEVEASLDLGQVFDWDFLLRPYLNLTKLFVYEDQDGAKLPNIRDSNLAFGLNFQKVDWGLDADLRFVYLGFQKETDFDSYPSRQVRTGGNLTADFFISKRIIEWEKYGKLSLKGEIRNIFNEYYATIYGYPMPGRSFYLGLRYDY